MSQNLQPLEPPAIHRVRAAQGWLELGNHLEANEELEKITPQFRLHPDVLQIRWQIYAKESKWEACADIARAIIQIAPERPFGWIHLAYATRRVPNGSVEAARDILFSAAQKFPRVFLIPYNLACYACQLGNLKEAWQLIVKAMSLANKKDIRSLALNDADLKPLWDQISEI